MESRRSIGPDILRGLAVLLVATAHMPYGHLPESFSTWVSRNGWYGVDIFFVLSGYLIGSELLRPVQAGDTPNLLVFYTKRVFRILPVFWLVLAVYVLFPSLREGPTMASAWRFATFTVNFGLDINVARSFSHAWSLCVEEHFYLVLPWLILLFHKLKIRWLPLATVAGLVIGGMVVRYVSWHAAQSAGGHPVDFLRLVYYPSWCRLDGLTAGVALAALRLFHGGLWARLARPLWLLPVSLACIGTAVTMTFATGQILDAASSVLVYPLFSFGVMLLLAALIELEVRLQPVRWTGIGFIAGISYSLYLCQKLVYAADIRWLPAGWVQGWSAVAVFYLSVIAVATLLWLAVERPFLMMRKRVLPMVTRNGVGASKVMRQGQVL
ncbi:acyltransferase family protein [Asticcacaulis solisilvae]|uniref:acyltransferase family protein n=1 Tax=Asticcacaulis solisilvae TaxID=1217274 RepID=UPI003FD84A96